MAGVALLEQANVLSMTIDSGPERGTVVALTLPTCSEAAVELEAVVRGRAAVSVRDSRTAAQRFTAESGEHRIVALGPAQRDWIDLRAAVVEDPKNLGALKSVLMDLATPLSTTGA